MSHPHLSLQQAHLVAHMINYRGKKQFLGEFLNFARGEVVKDHGVFIYDMTNSGFEVLPLIQQDALVTWSKGIKEKQALPASAPDLLKAESINRGRRSLILKGTMAGAGASVAGYEILRGKKLEKAINGLGLSLTAASLFSVMKKTAECENHFCSELPLWLKKSQGVDFSFPSMNIAAKSR